MARLILVEDEIIIATDIQSRLRDTDHDIISIEATGEGAITRAGELRPDVVLMDVVLKGEKDGIEAARQIIERFHIPIIFLTAHSDAATVKRATATASYGLLFKPFDVLELSAAIEMAIQRHGVEEKVRESDRRIREITDALPVVVYEADTTGRVIFANAMAFDMFGYTKEELEGGMFIFQVVTDADVVRARTMYRWRTGGDVAGRVEYTALRKDGSMFPISVHGVPIRRDGAVVGVRGIIVDITERKEAEERVKEHTHTMEILNRIMTEGNRATDVRSFAETATKLACELMHFDIGNIYLIDADARYATLQYIQGLPETGQGADEKIPCQDAPLNAILIDGEPLFAEDYVTFLPLRAPFGVESLASVPLFSQDTIIGVLNVGSATTHTFSQAEKDLLIAMGNEVGVVIAKLQTDEFIRTTLKEWEIHLKEIHHRVENNMQIVSSLLSLQAAGATEPETIEMLNESQRQIRSMALIHEQLYRSGFLTEIDFDYCVESLIDELLQMHNVAENKITITADIENVQLGMDAAITCALIINELVSNSLKYAFPDGHTGEVTVTLQHSNGAHTLTVVDDGVGFPADLDFRKTDSLGMQLVVTLVNQLKGTIELNRENGTAFIISFRVD